MIQFAKVLATRFYPIYPRTHTSALFQPPGVAGSEPLAQLPFPLEPGIMGLKFLFWFTDPIINTLRRSDNTYETGSALNDVSAAPMIHYRLLLGVNPDPTMDLSIHRDGLWTPDLQVGKTVFWKTMNPPLGSFHTPMGVYYNASNQALEHARGRIGLRRVRSGNVNTYAPGVYVVETTLNTGGFHYGLLEFCIANQNGSVDTTIGNTTYNIGLNRATQSATPGVYQPVGLIARAVGFALEI